MKRFTLLLLLLNLLLLVPVSFGQTEYFDDSDANLIKLGNAIYEIELKKQNGSLVSITDKSVGINLILGSLDNSLWQTVFENNTTLGGKDFATTGADTFSYAWDSASKTLQLNYKPEQSASGRVTAEVAITISEEPYFDMQISVNNHSGKVLSKVKFPQRFKLDRNQIDEALTPEKPGTILESDFFTSVLPGKGEYLSPHPPTVADYLAVQVQSGNLALYTVWTPGPIRQTVVGFENSQADTVLFLHDFDMWEANGTTWISPPVRIRISQGFKETVLAYRSDNKLDEFASIQQKLGDKYDTVLQSPLLHLDPMWVDKGFSKWPELFKRLPSPAILMLSNYYSGGFHGHHPDYVPPDPEYGTTEELQAAIEAAHDMGLLVMPMTLPMWWHENSPTIQNLSVPLTDVARLESLGNPDYFAWELGGQYDWGYFVNPRAPYVLQRLATYMDEIKQTLGCDLIYEDVIGASTSWLDFNSHAPKIFDTEGWIDHTRTYSHNLLMTENGYDHLAETQVGFLGGGWIADWQTFDVPHTRVYPMAGLLMHDKVLFYHYWAHPNTTRGSLSWNLTFGYMLNFPLQTIASGLYKPIGDPWQDINEDFQKYVVSRYADERMTDFAELSGGDVIQSDYETITVTANRSFSTPYTTNGYGLPPEGVLVTSTSGNLIAGSFFSYNNEQLSSGDHYIIEQRNQDNIIVRQPLGESSPLTLNYLSSWSGADPIWVLAYNSQNELIDLITPFLDDSGITFTYEQDLHGQHMAFYKVVNTSAPPQPNWTTFFDDNDQEIMLLGNKDYYEINLGKQNGALNYILDKTTGDTLCRGVQWWRLWLANFPEAPNPDVGPATMIDYWPGGPNDFQHNWDANDRTLTLKYVPDSTIYTEWVGATVTFTVSENAYLDMQISIENNWGYTMQSVSFPNNLLFDVVHNDAAYLPVSYPGVRLDAGFFDEGRSFEGEYPGRFNADYLALQKGNRVVALYGLWHNQPIRMVRTGFIYDDNHHQMSNIFVARKYPVWVDDGDTWNSPVLRIRFGEFVEETLQAYRTDNKLDLFESVENKLGSKYETLLQSPNFYVEFGEGVQQPFDQVASFLKDIPNPALITLSGYNEGGRHGHHPDYLPPDQQWGSTANLTQMVADLQSQGKLVMPAVLPVWWHENSATVQSLSSPSMDDIAQIGPEGAPVHFDMEGNPGIFVSPSHPFVNDRLAQMVSQIKQGIGGDLLFESGIGAFTSDYDFNPAAQSAQDYNEGWLEHTRTFKDSLLIVEEGYDGMAEAAVGFTGTLYQDPEHGESPWDFDFGENNWEPYPITPVLYHDKVLIYPFPHNSTLSKHALSWKLAFGCMLAFEPNENEPELDPSNQWVKMISDFQKFVISRIAGQPMTSFDKPAPGISVSIFGDMSVLNNWNKSGYPFEKYVVASSGAIATSSDNRLIAGIFTTFNNLELSSGDHYLIVETFEDSIVVRHPYGENSSISIVRPTSWEKVTGVKVTAFTEVGEHTIDQIVGDDFVTFDMSRELEGEMVKYFELSYDETISGVEAEQTLPTKYGLSQNYPNPFNPQTTIAYQLPKASFIELHIYNLLGQKIRTLIEKEQPPGYYKIAWDGKSDIGLPVTSGLYIFRLFTKEFTYTKKMIFLK